MTPEERLTRIEKNLEHHIEFVGASLTRLEVQVSSLAATGKETDKRLKETDEQLQQLVRQVDRTAAAGEETELRLQKLIGHVDGIEERVAKLDKKK